MQRRASAVGHTIGGFFIVGLFYIAVYSTGCEWLIFVAMILAALDAKRIQVWRYDSEIAYRPGTLFLLMLTLGWLILPWYVGLRLRIAFGDAELKEEYRWVGKSVPEYREPKPPAGLLKPWSRSWRERFWGSAFRRPPR